MPASNAPALAVVAGTTRCRSTASCGARGDLFYVLDRRGVPRPFTFQYHYTGNGQTVCYSRQHFDRRPAGFVTMTPVRRAVDMSEAEMEFRQLAADLMDIGRDHEAAKLLGTFEATGDPTELEAAKRWAVGLLDAEDES